MNDYLKDTSDVSVGEIVEITDHPAYGVLHDCKVGDQYRVLELMASGYHMRLEPLNSESRVFYVTPHVNWFRKAQPARARYWVKVYGPLIGGNHVFADGYDHYLVEQPKDVFLENDCVIIFAAPGKYGDRDVPAYSVTYLPGQATKVVMGIVTPKDRD